MPRRSIRGSELDHCGKSVLSGMEKCRGSVPSLVNMSLLNLPQYLVEDSHPGQCTAVVRRRSFSPGKKVWEVGLRLLVELGRT